MFLLSRADRFEEPTGIAANAVFFVLFIRQYAAFGSWQFLRCGEATHNYFRSAVKLGISQTVAKHCGRSESALRGNSPVSGADKSFRRLSV